MKKLILILLLNTIGICIYGQSPAIEWQKAYGGTGDDRAFSIRTTSDGGYITVGTSSSSDGIVYGNHGSGDFWVVKLSFTGDIEWQKSLGGSDYERATSVQQTTDGGYIVAGYSYSNNGNVSGNHGSDDFWVVKLSPSGSLEWQQSYGGTQQDEAYDIQQTLDGGYVIAGNTNSNDGDVTGNQGSTDIWVVKITGTGVLSWQKTFGSSGEETANSIRQTQDGGYIVAGTNDLVGGDVTANHGGNDYWILKLSATGVLQWQKSFGGSHEDDANSICETFDGGYIVAGQSYSTDGDIDCTGAGFWLLKLSNTGAILWKNCYGGYSAQEIQQTSDSGYIVCGYSQLGGSDCFYSDDHYLVLKLSTAGGVEWTKCIGRVLYDYAWSITQGLDGGYVVAGQSASSYSAITGLSDWDYFIAKLGHWPNGVSDLGSYGSVRVFPNPTPGSLSVEGLGIKSVIIYNSVGQIVKKTYYSKDISISEFSPGSYLIKVFDSNDHLMFQHKISKL